MADFSLKLDPDLEEDCSQLFVSSVKRNRGEDRPKFNPFVNRPKMPKFEVTDDSLRDSEELLAENPANAEQEAEDHELAETLGAEESQGQYFAEVLSKPSRSKFCRTPEQSKFKVGLEERLLEKTRSSWHEIQDAYEAAYKKLEPKADIAQEAAENQNLLLIKALARKRVTDKAKWVAKYFGEDDDDALSVKVDREALLLYREECASDILEDPRQYVHTGNTPEKKVNPLVDHRSKDGRSQLMMVDWPALPPIDPIAEAIQRRDKAKAKSKLETARHFKAKGSAAKATSTTTATSSMESLKPKTVAKRPASKFKFRRH